MDFTVWQDHAMGPGGKRSMNLRFLSSTNSQNRKLQSFFAKTLNRIELPTVDPGWSCRQGSGLLLLTADVEKIAELASLKFGSNWFSSNRYDASDKLKMTPSPTLSEEIYCYRKPGSEIRKPCSRYALLPEAWFRDLISWSRDKFLWCLYTLQLIRLNYIILNCFYKPSLWTLIISY